MAITYPASPVNGDTHTEGGVKFRFHDAGWFATQPTPEIYRVELSGEIGQGAIPTTGTSDTSTTSSFTVVIATANTGAVSSGPFIQHPNLTTGSRVDVANQWFTSSYVQTNYQIIHKERERVDQRTSRRRFTKVAGRVLQIAGRFSGQTAISYTNIWGNVYVYVGDASGTALTVTQLKAASEFWYYSRFSAVPNPEILELTINGTTYTGQTDTSFHGVDPTDFGESTSLGKYSQGWVASGSPDFAGLQIFNDMFGSTAPQVIQSKYIVWPSESSINIAMLNGGQMDTVPTANWTTSFGSPVEVVNTVAESVYGN